LTSHAISFSLILVVRLSDNEPELQALLFFGAPGAHPLDADRLDPARDRDTTEVSAER
jgi:hypothetical protein